VAAAPRPAHPHARLDLHGAFVLGEAGVLDGRRATTHWLYLQELQARFPAARVVDDGIYVKDGNVWTSAGITAGIDLTLALVEEDHGHRVAMQVAKRLVLFLRRSGNQAQFSSALRRRSGSRPGCATSRRSCSSTSTSRCPSSGSRPASA
jgi:transcriptional regulator GlxA family with amidase domain